MDNSGDPVLRYDRTVGTRKEKRKPGMESPCKRGTSHFGKSGWAMGSRDAERNKVAKSVSHASRKAAIVCTRTRTVKPEHKVDEEENPKPAEEALIKDNRQNGPVNLGIRGASEMSRRE